MIVALLNGRAGAGKTTLALHLAGAWASGGERIVLIDADPARDALRWHEARLHAGLPPRFRVLPAAAERLDRRALRRIGRRCDRLIVDGPTGAAARSLPALLACDLSVIPIGPSAADMDAAREMVGPAMKARDLRPGLRVRFAFNRRSTGADAAREIAGMRLEYEPALLDSAVGRHAILAELTASGRLLDDVGSDAAVRHEIAALAAEIGAIPISAGPPVSIVQRLLHPWLGSAPRRRGASAAEAAAIRERASVVSFVTVPADPRAQVRAADQASYPIEIIETRSQKEASMPENIVMAGDAPASTETRQSVTAPAQPDSAVTRTQPQASAPDAAPAPDTEAIATRAREAERDRVSTIYDLAGRLNLERGFAEDLVKRGVSVDESCRLILDQVAAKSDETRTFPHVSVPLGGRDERITDFGDARLWSETTRIDLRVAEVPNPRPGDRIEIDGDAFLIQGEPVRDCERLVWTVDLRPA